MNDNKNSSSKSNNTTRIKTTTPPAWRLWSLRINSFDKYNSFRTVINIIEVVGLVGGLMIIVVLVIVRGLYWIVLIPLGRLNKIIYTSRKHSKANVHKNNPTTTTKTPPQPSPSLICNYSNKNFTNSTNPTWTTMRHPPPRIHNPPTTHKNHSPKWTHVAQCCCRMTSTATIITQRLSTSCLNSSVRSCSRLPKKLHTCKVLSSDNLSY